MISWLEAWQRHLWLWALPVSFCVLNLLGFTFYGWAFAGKVERLERQYEATTKVLAALHEEHRLVVDFLDRVESNRDETDGLYHDYFQTEARRFTRIIQEVKKLARQAGLQPSSWSYPKKDFGGYGLVQRSITFNVDGTYDQLRKFINFLELSEHFLTLNSVTLSGSSSSQRGNPKLGIKLAVSTMFATREIEARAEEPAT